LISTYALLVAAAMVEPLPIPESLDRDTMMVGKGSHFTKASAGFIQELVANGAPEDIALAEDMLDALLDCQDMRQGARHHGNFRWYREDECVTDKNAVEFVMSHLIPMMIQHGDRLPAPIGERVTTSIRAALDEIRRMDVAVTYTNIAALDCANSCLGGELLEDDAVAERGYAKFEALAAVTAGNGTVFEYYSPGYTKTTMRALHSLASHVQHEVTRVRARAMIARLALTTALHVHPATNKLTGPHSRTYFTQIVGEAVPAGQYLRDWVNEGVVPTWVERVLERSMPLPMQIDESAQAGWHIGMTSYLDRRFALGVATREISRQSNCMMIHYPSGNPDRPGVILSRYLTNDTWFTPPTDGEEPRFPYDGGKFWGVQHGPRALCLYAPRGVAHPDSLAPASLHLWRSAKAAVIWLQYQHVGDVWINDQRVESLPVDVPEGAVVVVESGPIYTAVMPLSRTELGHESPMRLVEANGMLALEMYNYLGPMKAHNDLERMSRFYRGQVQCGFFIEVADRKAYPNAAEFADTVARGAITDEVGPEQTAYMEEAQRPWHVEYRRDDHILGMEVDLMAWTLKRRWTESGNLGYPMLEAPVARQSATGLVQVDGGVVTCDAIPAWLYADGEGDLYVAGCHGEAGQFTLRTPSGEVRVPAMRSGTVVWDRGVVTVETHGSPGNIEVVGGSLAE
jgi:hypothetical protein